MRFEQRSRRMKKPRRLWIGLEIVSVPKGTTRGLILDVLRESIMSKQYDLPEGWQINLRWKNSERAEMKIGEWSEELADSADSSEGFNYAVLSYLERQRGSTPERRIPEKEKEEAEKEIPTTPPPPPPPTPKKRKPKAKPKRRKAKRRKAKKGRRK